MQTKLVNRSRGCGRVDRERSHGFGWVGGALIVALITWPHGSRADGPLGRYEVTLEGTIPGGTVNDTKTHLVWQRESPVQAKSWDEAQAYCQSLGDGWRIPSFKELQTIVVWTGGDEPITGYQGFDPEVFPDRGDSYIEPDGDVSSVKASFWAGPTDRGANSSGVEAEMAYVIENTTALVFTETATHRARCVR